MMATLEQLIATCVMTPRHDPSSPTCVWGLPLNIIGPPGVGKSERVVAAVKAVGLQPFPLFPASKQPEDFGGAPMMTPDGLVLECILPQGKALINLGQGVLVIDELTTARPAVQAACLGLVNDRRIGDHLLPPRVRIITAMNPAELAASGFVLEGPLANRMMHYNYVVPTVDEWIDWLVNPATSAMEHISNVEQHILVGWASAWSSARGLLAGFLKSNPSQLLSQPKPDDPAYGGAWPSPRMWNWAGRGMAAARCLGMPKDISATIIEGCVGSAIMPEWVEWLSKADLPSPEEILVHRAWHPDNKRLDITIAAFTSMMTWLLEMGSQSGKTGQWERQQELAASAWDILKETIELGNPDLVVSSASKLVSAELGHTVANQRTREKAKEVILRLGRDGYASFAKDNVV